MGQLVLLRHGGLRAGPGDDEVRRDHRRAGRGGTFHRVLFHLPSKHQLMTAGMVHVTNLTPGSGGNPSRAYGQKHQFMTASLVYDDSRYGPCDQSDTPRE
jgi:hypothetical protein